MRQPNKACIDIIKSFEGLFLKPYLCPAGIPTIGYGTIRYPDGTSVSLKDSPISEQDAERYLMHEINEKANGVESLLTIKVSDNEFGALVSFAYNLGLGNLKKSTLLKILNADADRQKIGDEFLKWNKAAGKELSGLTRRRQAERALFLQPDTSPSNLPEGPSDKEIEEKLEQIEKDITS
ncbi:MAG: lysozyme [Alphaproteobacteria bacterium]|nr:lysozyme [Alphaproteobacteria bacterium]